MYVPAPAGSGDTFAAAGYINPKTSETSETYIYLLLFYRGLACRGCVFGIRDTSATSATAPPPRPSLGGMATTISRAAPAACGECSAPRSGRCWRSNMQLPKQAAQAIRAILLASATVVTLAGRRSINRPSQGRFFDLAASSRHIEPGRSTAKAFGANMGASPLNAGAAGCRELRDRGMQGGEPPLSDIGSSEDGQGFESALRINGMASLAAISAMRHVSVCQCHGGRMLVARLRFQRRAYRHRFTFS